MAISKRLVIAQMLAAATVAMAAIYTMGFLDKFLEVGVAKISGLIAIALSVAAFALSIKLQSTVVAELLIAAGIIIMMPPVIAIVAAKAIVFPGPILGVISYSPILVLGIAKAVTASMKKVTAVAPS